MHGFFIEPKAKKNRLYLMFLEPAVFIGLEYAAGFFVHGRVREVDVLLQVADGVVLGNVDASAVDAFLAQDHLEKRGLAATVTAYEPHAFVVAHEHAGTVEQHLLAKGLGNVLDLNHGVKFSYFAKQAC